MTLPAFVARALRDCLACGRLEHGCLRVKCDGCRHEHLVAFSCKRRGFCPSCGARRMVETSAHLVDHVFGWLVEDPEQPWLDLEPTDGIDALRAASIRYRIALGPQSGRRTLTLVDPSLARPPPAEKPFTANLQGFSLNAAVACAAHQRDRLERLCRYVTRPAIALDRLSVSTTGEVRLALKRPFRGPPGALPRGQCAELPVAIAGGTGGRCAAGKAEVQGRGAWKIGILRSRGTGVVTG